MTALHANNTNGSLDPLGPQAIEPRQSSAPAIVLCVLTLLTIGVVMVTSASLEIRPVPLEVGPGEGVAGSPTIADVLRSKQAILMGLALLAMACAAALPIERLRALLARPGAAAARHPIAALAIAAALLLALLSLVYTDVLGREENGGARWVRVPGLGDRGFQPSEVAKWALVVVLAWYAASIGPAIRTFGRGLVPGAVAAGLIAGMVAREDLGTGVLIGSVAGVVLLAAGVRLWQALLLAPPALLGALALVATSEYRTDRVVAFLDPYADPVGDGYHMIQSMATIAGAGPVGRGLGHGLQKHGFLPEDTNDFLFAIITEELGIAGALLVAAPLLILVWVLRGVAARAHDRFTRLVVLGVACTIAFQTVINLFVVTGMAPTKGIALPLVSAGGTGWVLTAASLGLVIALERADAARHRPIGAHA